MPFPPSPVAPLLGTAAQVVRTARRAAERWAVESQTIARRNAEAATGRLARLRAEREDVEDYLRSRA